MGADCCHCSGSWSCDHALRLAVIMLCRPGSVPCSLSHCCSFARLVFHCCLVPVNGQQRMCCLSSNLALHQGHCANNLCLWHCIFFPCTNCPMICFVTQCCLCAGIWFMAFSNASVSSSAREGERLGNFVCQYCFASGPFNALCIACFWFFTVCVPPISRCHGLLGSW